MLLMLKEEIEKQRSNSKQQIHGYKVTMRKSLWSRKRTVKLVAPFTVIKVVWNPEWTPSDADVALLASLLVKAASEQLNIHYSLNFGRP